jgi:cytochrome c biogenesis protein CcmG/thiol:disulfide interchange protein DsbE
MDALQIGLFALPWVRVQVALALLALVVVAEVLARRVDRRLSPWVYNAILVGLLGARVGFVLENASVYARDPLSALYVWQGGFDPLWGILAGGGYTLMTLPKHLWRYAALAGVVALVVAWASSCRGGSPVDKGGGYPPSPFTPLGVPRSPWIAFRASPWSSTPGPPGAPPAGGSFP